MLVVTFPMFISNVEVPDNKRTGRNMGTLYLYVLKTFSCPMGKSCHFTMEQAWYINFLRTTGEYLNELKAEKKIQCQVALLAVLQRVY